ncbi:DMT family transporter [Desulfovibrio sp. OttesenSCG-928-G15]|nr:DMT family transporter [Desulfovibrio sp. OttesenSCG-928-G15]
MTTPVILLLLASALLHASWNAIIKGGANKLFETAMQTMACGLFGLCALLCLPLPAPASWPFLTGSVCLHFFYHLLLANAYKGADMSYAYTIMRGSCPLFTALFTVFVLGHSLLLGAWAGVLLLSTGILVLALDTLRKGHFQWLPTCIALGNAVIIMGYTVVDGSGVRVSGHAVAYVAWLFFLNAFPLVLFSLVRHKREFIRHVQTRWKFGLASGFCGVLAYGISVWAMTRAPISLVAALRESSVIFGMLLAVVYLKEPFSALRALSVLLVMTGACCIKLFA